MRPAGRRRRRSPRRSRRIVMPIGTSISPPRATLPASAKTLVPLLLGRAERGEGLRAVADDPRHQRERLDVVDQRRLCPTARSAGIRRPQPRHAAPALDRGDQRRLLAADERPGALPSPRQLQANRAAQHVLAQHARAAGTARAPRDPLDRQRVLGADVEDALARRRPRRPRSPCPRSRGRGTTPAACGP